MEKTRAASILTGLFVVLVGLAVFLIDRPAGRIERAGGAEPSLRPEAHWPGERPEARPRDPAAPSAASSPSAAFGGREALAAVVIDDLGNTAMQQLVVDFFVFMDKDIS